MQTISTLRAGGDIEDIFIDLRLDSSKFDWVAGRKNDFTQVDFDLRLVSLGLWMLVHDAQDFCHIKVLGN